MIRKGEALYCINTVYHYETGEVNFFEGKLYVIRSVSNDGVTFQLITENSIQCSVSLDSNSSVYSKNFITYNQHIALMRDEQIKDILDLD